MDTYPETERLILRRLTHEDADLLHALDNDPQVMRWLNGGTPTPRAVIEQKILPRMLAASTEEGFGYWAALPKETGEFLGWFSFRPVEGEPNAAELGYRLFRAVWGRGFATEGARALIRRGFTELGLERIVATTYEHNLASRSVLEKCGFRLVRRHRLTEEELLGSDSMYFAEEPVLFDGSDLDYVLDRSSWEQFP